MWLLLTLLFSLSCARNPNLVRTPELITNHSSYTQTLNFIIHEVKEHLYKTIDEPPMRTTLNIKPVLEEGAHCVFDVECETCLNGYSNKCVANRCQCFPARYSSFFSAYEYLPTSSNVDCINSNQFISVLVYYDRGIQVCVKEPTTPRKSVHTCPFHYTMVSRVDGMTYCLNARDPFDMVCTENRMCQEALNSRAFIGFCINGVCHAISAKQYESVIVNTYGCNPHFRQYCLEEEYDFISPTHEKTARCATECFSTQSISGIQSSSTNKCLCLTKTSIPANIIEPRRAFTSLIDSISLHNSTRVGDLSIIDNLPIEDKISEADILTSVFNLSSGYNSTSLDNLITNDDFTRLTNSTRLYDFN